MGLNYFRNSRSFLVKFQKFSMRQSFKMSTDTGHQHGDSSSATPEQEILLNKIKIHQEKAPRLSMAEEVRTLIANSIKYGVLSTNSNQLGGYPTGSIVGFELDDNGLPFFVFSSMSAHTKDLVLDNRCSLTVTSKDFQNAAHGRITLVGKVDKLNDATKQADLRSKYLNHHKDAYWIDFG